MHTISLDLLDARAVQMGGLIPAIRGLIVSSTLVRLAGTDATLPRRPSRKMHKVNAAHHISKELSGEGTLSIQSTETIVALFTPPQPKSVPSVTVACGGILGLDPAFLSPGRGGLAGHVLRRPPGPHVLRVRLDPVALGVAAGVHGYTNQMDLYRHRQ